MSDEYKIDSNFDIHLSPVLNDYSYREELVKRGYATFSGHKNKHNQFECLEVDLVKILSDIAQKLDLKAAKND